MAKYGVEVPIAGYMYIEVEAEIDDNGKEISYKWNGAR